MKKSLLLCLVVLLCLSPSLSFSDPYTGGSLTVTHPQPSGNYVLEGHESKIVPLTDTDTYNIGKLKVTGTVRNLSEPHQKEVYSMIVEGFDASGRCIEVNSTDRVNLPSGIAEKVSVYLSLGSQISTYRVYLVDGEATSGTWDLLTYSSRIVNKNELDINAKDNAGKLKVQAVVKNGMVPQSHQVYTLVVEGYDASGKCIEVNSQDRVNAAPGFTDNVTVYLSLGSKIKSFKAYLVDGEALSGKWDLVASSSRIVSKDELDMNAKTNAGKLKVQAVVKSGLPTSSKELYTLVVEGYDLKGNCIETRKASQINIASGFTGNSSVYLSQSAKIKTTRLILVDGDSLSDKFQLISYSSRLLEKEDVTTFGTANTGKLYVTTLVKNNASTDKPLNMMVIAYDATGKKIDSQTKSSTSPSGYVSEFTFYLKSGVSVKTLKFFMIEGSRSTEMKRD